MAAEAEDRALQLESFFLPPRGAGGAGDKQTKPSTNWLEEPELPAAEEILSTSSPYLLSVKHENLTSKSEYLEKQYRMQRYEAVEPTRLAVSQFRLQPEMPEGDHAYIYTDVQVQGVVLTDHGAAIRVSFSTSRAADAPVDWANSGRLCQGSLVVLSPMEDHFKSKCSVATVAYRFLTGGLWPDPDSAEPDDTPPRVDLFFSTWDEELLDPNISYYMLEAKNGYFESFRHTMVALQTATLEKSVIDKFVLSNDISEIPVAKNAVELRPHTRDTLDKSQVSASVAIIRDELSVTQGPPGTGKTHTTVATVEEIIRFHNPTKPIIIAAQTNHAVDQLLDRCLHKDLDICRLGGRTVSDSIEQHTLFQTREKNKGKVAGIRLPPGAWQDMETARQVLELHLKKAIQGQQNYDVKSFRDAKIITAQQFDSLQDEAWETSAETDPLLAWLRWEAFVAAPKANLYAKWKPTPNADTGRRLPDPDKPIGPFIQLRKRLEPQAARFKNMLARTRDLYKIKVQHRAEVFDYMCYELSRKSQEKLEESYTKFQAACRRLWRSKMERDHRVVTKVDIQIIGCTITGLSKYRELLCKIAPDILIIDEASEATEGSIAAALLPSLKHLALVGDHQQLTPRAISRILSEPVFAFDVSLFERLVTSNGMPCQVLNMQRRMIPEIRQLVNVFYPRLGDHSSVLKRDKVKGIGPPLWWFDHSWPEQTNSGVSGQSISNDGEADMIVHFARYLFCCGTPVDKLTILTFYTAQKELIEQKLGAPNLKICKTVDSFQGCENDVVILSVVRSPPSGQARAGFVENIHRATVALSRARNAFYIFGNASNLKHSETWRPVLDVLGQLREKWLPLVCPIHKTTTLIRCLKDWLPLSESGCRGELCKGDTDLETRIQGKSVKAFSDESSDYYTLVPKRQQRKRHSFIAAMATTNLTRGALDRVDKASPIAIAKNTSSAVLSQNSSSQNSDYMIEVGYDTFIAEVEMLALVAREEAVEEKLVYLGQDEMAEETLVYPGERMVGRVVDLEYEELTGDLMEFDS